MISEKALLCSLTCEGLNLVCKQVEIATREYRKMYPQVKLFKEVTPQSSFKGVRINVLG
jgi:hypothetical protein